MPLTPGTRLGVYDITAQIGEGGMGQVFRATDTKLKRQVAIKILPPAVAADAERLARFQREAEVLASLNHPNIAAIYGLEESEGMTALVMELVEGDDLSQRIARGVIPIDEALPIAKQIAEALEAAHEQGIIHRDLKPANIKVRADGQVKVLDFGLAKAAEGGRGQGIGVGENLSQLPTLRSPALMTGAGMILGTAAYMSPEQARGKVADKRADIWAFGCVLFEMLTGRRAFEGDEVSDTLAAVLRAEPDWKQLPAQLPAGVHRLVRRCLERDLSRRIQSAGDLRIRLLEAGEEGPPAATLVYGRQSRPFRLWVGLAVASVLVFIAGAAAMRLRQPPAPEGQRIVTEIVTPETSEPISIALSPDGRSIAFVASDASGSRLWVRSLSTEDAKPLPGTERALSPFWSPDSRTLGFFADGNLKRVDVSGGHPQSIADGVPRGGAWGADGVILFCRNATGPLFRVQVSGGNSVPATTLNKQNSHRYPSLLPDGRRFLFFGLGEVSESGIFLGALDGRPAKRLVTSDAPGVFLAPDWLLWTKEGDLIVQRLDLDREELVGEPQSLHIQVAFDDLTLGSALTASATGLVAYRGQTVNQRRLTWFDRTGKVLGVAGRPNEQAFLGPRVSPVGDQIAAYRTVSGNMDVWLVDGTQTTRLTFDRAQERLPVWSPDGTRIAFDSTRNGPRNLFVKAAQGEGPEESLLKDPLSVVMNDWSHDGRFVLYLQNDPVTSYDIMAVPLAGARTPFPVVKTPASDRGGVFSPDGRWVAYHSNESGHPEVYIRRFVDPSSPGTASEHAGQWQVSAQGGIYAMWSPTGRELYYLSPDGMLMAAPITTGAVSIQVGTPVRLFDPQMYGGGIENQQARQYDVSRDGRFLVNRIVGQTTTPITLIQNWQGGLSAGER